MGTVQLRPDRVVAWRPERLAIDPWTVLRLARYRRRDDAPAPVWDATRAMAALAGELAAPAAGLRLVRVAAVVSTQVCLAEGPCFSGHAVARHLSGARRAVAFVLTLGPALEAEIVALGERQELLEAYLLDLAGWASIEAAVRVLRRDLVAALPARVCRTGSVRAIATGRSRTRASSCGCSARMPCLCSSPSTECWFP